MKTLRGFIWNARVGRDPISVTASVRAMLRGYDADVAIICEATTYVRQLRQIKGYRVFTGRGRGESSSTVVLVRRNLRVPRWRLLSTNLRWRGPVRGLLHIGRVFPVVDIGPARNGWRIIGAHRVPNGVNGPNAREWDAEERILTRYAGFGGSRRRALVIGGDMNTADLRGLAREIDARVVRDPAAPVDYLLVRGAHGVARAGLNHGSDHRAVRFELTRS